jgi:hypothetical protein
LLEFVSYRLAQSDHLPLAEGHPNFVSH